MADHGTVRLSPPGYAATDHGLPEVGVCEGVLVECGREASGRRMRLYGTLDPHGASALRLDFSDHGQGAESLTLDLVELTSVDPAALKTLVRRQRRATRAGSELRIRISPQQVAALLAG